MMINVLYLAWILVNEFVVVEACTVNQFECSNGDCIDIGLRCNDDFDCGDMSDEVNCSAVIACPEGQYRCNDGQCVDTDARCNCVIECNDGTDEQNCVMCSISTSLTSVEDLSFVHATSIIATASMATPVTSLDITSSFDKLYTEGIDSKIWTSSDLQSEMTNVLKSSLVQTEALHTLKTNRESDKGYIYSSVDMPISFSFDLQTSNSYFMSEIYKTSFPLHSTFLIESTLLSPYSTYSLNDSLSSFAGYSGATPVLSTVQLPSLTIQSTINSVYDIKKTSTSSEGFEIFPSLVSTSSGERQSLLFATSLPDVILPSVTYSSTALQLKVHTSTITTNTSFDTHKLTTVLSIKEELKTSTPNLEISRQTTHSLYESVVTDSRSSPFLTTSSSVLSTPQNGVIPDDKNDNDYIIPVTIAVCVVLAIVLCIMLWKYREHLRKATRSKQFGSNLSLDMVHPHPDQQNGFSQSHMVKNTSYRAFSDP